MVLRVRHYLKIDAQSPNIDPKSQMGAWSVPKLKPDFGKDFERYFSSILAPQGTPKTMKNIIFEIIQSISNFEAIWSCVLH